MRNYKAPTLAQQVKKADKDLKKGMTHEQLLVKYGQIVVNALNSGFAFSQKYF